jgi:hypothetical protein
MIDQTVSGRSPSRSTPTAFQLQAAILAAQVVSAEGSSMRSVRASYRAVVTGGLYGVDDLVRGESLLIRAHLLQESDDAFNPSEELLELRELPTDVASEVLLRKLFLVERPLWLYAAISDEDVRWENVPDGDQKVLHQLIVEATRRESFLLTLGKTIDLEYLADLGGEGEEHVIAECRRYLTKVGRADLATGVRRVSLHSDQLGYDVTSPDTLGRRHRIEVKTMGSAVERAEFFLSRNEARTGRNDPLWSLVVVRKDRNGSMHLLGWCASENLVSLLPTDPHPHGRWASTRISVPLETLRPGLPLDAV